MYIKFFIKSSFFYKTQTFLFYFYIFSLLSLIFLFFGWYPLLQPKLLRLPSRLLRLICKLLFCNGAIALAYGLLLWVFQLGDLAESTPLLNAILVVCGNITFLLLDRVLVRLERLWRQTLRHKFFPHA